MALLDKIILLKESIVTIAFKHKFKQIGVFGSVSRREENENSDNDFVVFPEEKANLVGLMQTEIELEILFDRKVEIVSINGLSDDFKSHMNKDLDLL